MRRWNAVFKFPNYLLGSAWSSRVASIDTILGITVFSDNLFWLHDFDFRGLNAAVITKNATLIHHVNLSL